MSGNYAYASGGVSVPVYSPRTVTTIMIEIRNGGTGRLAQVGRDSSVIFQVLRNITVPNLLAAAQEQSSSDDKEDDKIDRLIKVVEKQEKIINSLLRVSRKRLKLEDENDGHATSSGDTEEKQPDVPSAKKTNDEEKQPVK